MEKSQTRPKAGMTFDRNASRCGKEQSQLLVMLYWATSEEEEEENKRLSLLPLNFKISSTPRIPKQIATSAPGV